MTGKPLRSFAKTFGIALVTLVVALGSEALAQRSDVVVRVRGDREESLQGVIEQITRSRLHMQQYDGQRVVAADYSLDEVQSWTINYSLRLRGQPSTAEPFRGADFAEGRQAMLNQNWAEAIARFSAAAENSQQEFAKLISRMHLVECGLSLGSSRANVTLAGGRREQMTGYQVAAHFAGQFQRLHQQSYYLADVLVWAGRAHELGGNNSEAISAYRDLADLDEAQGNYRMALLHYRNQSWTQARDAFRRARNAAARDRNTVLAESCDVAIGRVNIEMGNWDEARQVFERLVGEGGSQDRSVLGSSYLGLGLCLVNQRRWREAFMALATAATAFKENVSDEDLQLALGLCVRIAERLAESDESWAPRAERLRREFNQRYRGVDLPEIR